MIGFQFHNIIPTKAAINGPFLRFTGAGTTQPFSTSICSGTTATFTGVATAFFPTQDPPLPNVTNVGIVTYRWYEVGVGALSDSATVTGTATTTLSILNVRTPQDSGRRFYLKADYIASSGESFAGNAVNDPLDSEIATLNVLPNVVITSQPTSQLVGQNIAATFSVTASSTDATQGFLSYQWSLDGNDLTDGTTVLTSQVNQFNQTYSNDATVDLPSDSTDINITIAGARGGNGGSDAGGPGGSGGAGRVGAFTLPDGGRTLNLRCGDSGSSGGSGNFPVYGPPGGSTVAAGGRGGGAGGSGWSGGGGGGGGASGVYDSSVGSYVIVAGGGGGGGGGSWNRGAPPGSPAGDWSASSGSFSISNGGQGEDKGGDGGGGGAGGGGATGGSGGGSGQDNAYGGGGGSGGGSRYDSNASTFKSGSSSTNDGDGYISLQFKSANVAGTVVTARRTRTVSGSTTRTLTLTSDAVGLGTVRCRVTNPVACNSPVLTDVVNYNVVTSREIVNYEQIAGSSLITTGNQNLFNGSLTFYGDPGNNMKNIIIYPTEKDIIVKITLAASAGLANGSNRGGAGGLCVFQYTLRRNNEYNIILGVTGLNGPGGNIGGGVGAFFYDKAKAVICCGGGGGAGANARGGDGGGAGIAGENGLGTFGGNGGARVSNGALPTNGFFAGGSSTENYTQVTGGRLSSCTIGDSYFTSRYSSCQNIGLSQFLNSSGTIVSGTASLTRGFKSGLSHRNNAGNGTGTNGGGGQGVIGGNGAGGSGSGGGGGSGYSSGDATIISSVLGGNTSTSGYVTIELA